MRELLRYENKGIGVSKTPFTLSDGVTLTLFDFKGEGHEKKPMLLFVAGWLSALSGWHEVLEEMTPHTRVLYMESREKRSARLPAGPLPRFDIDRLADDIAEVANAFIPAETSLYVAGSSLGSTALIRAMARRKITPSGAFLISPVTAFQFPPWGNFIISFVPPFFFKAIRYPIVWYLINFRVDKKKEPEQARKYTQTIMDAEPTRLKANAAALSGHTVWEDLPQVKSPVVVIGAASDKLHGVEEITKMVQRMPEARVEVMGSNKETHSGQAGRFIVEGMGAG
ncbi:alpha/beta hydrolase [Desulfoluna sp.]|uniref:alpha/beta fold hydrolase n=1 Tax=Desulfoluna sp. TaxID=2045199 RepID=UPI0026293540|nr:alpha/beta hydrolase [Desulfoluna sp.]